MRSVIRSAAALWMVAISASALAGGYVHEHAGSVSIAVGKDSSHLVAENEPVVPGSVIRTGDNSYAVLKFEDGEVVSMEANSTLKIRRYRYSSTRPKRNSVLFSMYKGTMRFITGEIGQRNPRAFRLATPDATIRVIGTDFLVSISNNVTYSQVLSGSISLTNASGMRRLKAGQTSLTKSAKKATVLVKPDLVPAETFTKIAAIPVPEAVPGPLPEPVPAIAEAATAGAAAVTEAGAATISPAGSATTATATQAMTTEANSAATSAVAGGAATGGAAASSSTVAAASTGISATTIGIGVGVAAIIAASVHQSNATTTHH